MCCIRDPGADQCGVCVITVNTPRVLCVAVVAVFADAPPTCPACADGFPRVLLMLQRPGYCSVTTPTLISQHAACLKTLSWDTVLLHSCCFCRSHASVRICTLSGHRALSGAGDSFCLSTWVISRIGFAYSHHHRHFTLLLLPSFHRETPQTVCILQRRLQLSY